jgi:hypothetical protein
MKLTPIASLVACTLLGILLANSTYAQTKIDWKTLSKIGWKNEFNEALGYEVAIPVFDKAAEALNGKEVTITGYVLPVDTDGGQYIILSANPYASCFFCGGAGPETVMEIYLQKKQTFPADAKAVFKGKLKLNYDDAYHLIYMLENAQLVSLE